MGKTFISTELGSGGSSTARSNLIAKRGIRNILKHAKILAGDIEPLPSTMLDMPTSDCFVFSEHEGLFEMCADLGPRVAKGEVIARIWPIDRTGETAQEYRAGLSGILAGRHFPGLIKMGDCLAVVATELA
jgi:N-alpha-acetyl-L-2,4-diaminobutyrate deacetylase